MEYRVCVWAASLVGKERSKETKWRYGNLLSFLLRCGTRPYERGTQMRLETKWSYERVEKTARIVGGARDYVHRM